MKRVYSIVENHDGWAGDSKSGPKHSFSYSKHVDFRKNATSLTVLPKAVKETSTTVTGLVTAMVQLPSGKMVAIDASGGVYTRATNGTWAKNGTTLNDTACGMVYNFQHDTIYVPGLTAVHSITNADGRFSGGSFTVNSNAFVANVDDSATTSTQTYTTTNAVNEGATHKLSITPTYEPLYSIKIWVTTKGSDDLTVTVHDAANNVLGTSTLANGSIADGALNEFVFSTPIRMMIGATYHFHITHASASSSTIGTGTASDFSDARYETYINRLIGPVNNFHPAIEFLQYICIGNERYLTVWEPISQSAPGNTEWQRHRLTFPPGYEVTSLAVWTEYLAIACEKRSTSSTNEFQSGKIFFWDGVSTTYNFIIDVPEGSPYSLFSHRNVLYYLAGGGWNAWAGGNPTKLFQMPGTDFEFTDAETYMVNYPNMMTVRNGILLTGFPSETNSTAIEHGVYSFGARNKNYNESFGFSYTTSNGTITNGTLRLGMVKSFGDKLFISWRDDTTYGVDIVDTDSDPFATATWESLIMDFGRTDKEKTITEMIVTFKTLPTGATVTPKYKINRASSWQNDDDAVQATAGDTSVKLNINKQFKELQLALDFGATTATPEITSVSIVVDLNETERD